LAMICDYDSSLPEPMRIGAASVHCRSIDERIARLWQIGSVPRVRYPAFMRQRRDLVRLLPVGLQLNWLALSLVRIEPLVAALAGETSDFQRLAEAISNEGAERDVLLAVENAISGIESLVGEPVVKIISAVPGKADLGSLLWSWATFLVMCWKGWTSIPLPVVQSGCSTRCTWLTVIAAARWRVDLPSWRIVRGGGMLASLPMMAPVLLLRRWTQVRALGVSDHLCRDRSQKSVSSCRKRRPVSGRGGDPIPLDSAGSRAQRDVQLATILAGSAWLPSRAVGTDAAKASWTEAGHVPRVRRSSSPRSSGE
jgi:hypothetical protein